MSSEYRKQTAFLKLLMAYDDNAQHRELGDLLSAAEKNERCLLGACRLVGLISLLSLAGLGYSAVLLPEFFDNTTHIVIRFFCALGLGSFLCFAVFLSLWFGYRKTCDRIREKCRQAIMATLAAKLGPALSHICPSTFESISSNITTLPAEDSACKIKVLSELQKVS